MQCCKTVPDSACAVNLSNYEIKNNKSLTQKCTYNE